MKFTTTLLAAFAAIPHAMADADADDVPGTATFCIDKCFKGRNTTIDIQWDKCMLVPDSNAMGQPGASFLVSVGGKSACDFYPDNACAADKMYYWKHSFDTEFLRGYPEPKAITRSFKCVHDKTVNTKGWDDPKNLRGC